jgi:hypothetical protein
MSNPTSLFHNLRKVKQKSLRYSFHRDNYRFYSRCRIIPTGLQLQCTPALGTLPPQLQAEWNSILYSSSIRLINILSEHCESTLNSLKVDIDKLYRELQASCSDAELIQYTYEIDQCLSRRDSELVNRRNKKTAALLEKQKRYKHRRFRLQTPEPVPASSTVVNLSSSTLSDAEHNLLSRGLKFCPTPPDVNQVELSQDLTQYYRRIRLREFFLDAPPSVPEPFREKSTWVPPKNRVPSLETYVQVVSTQVNTSERLSHRSHDNLPREERQALNSIRSRTDIIIKPADKGSAVVVMDRQKYIDEAMNHLDNRNNYATLDSDPSNTFSQQIQLTLDDMHQRTQLSDKAYKFLSPTNCSAARFYLLPKIHKPGNPGRPIISGNGSPTENISLFVDNFIKPLVSKVPSYIHDTPDFLRKLEVIKNQIPSTAIIGTFDVSSLYTNIPHQEGIEASCAALTKIGHCSPPISDIEALMNHVLTKNNFTFMDKDYLQVHGTAMGSRMAPSWACLFMSSLEERMLAAAPCRPWTWWRYIDDIFFIWTSDEGSLLTFIDHINSFHRTIKFTSDYSHQQANFLDVTIQKAESGVLTTDLYTKPTDTHQYLHASSCHPRHCKTGIAYSQALRLRRICSNDSKFSHHAQNLKNHLVARGHSSTKVQQAIRKVYSLPRATVLEERPRNHDPNPKIPLVTTFHPNLPPLRQIANTNHHILHTSDRLRRAVPDKPILAYRRPRNLRDMIVRATVPPLLTDDSLPTQHGTFKCDSISRCVVCRDHIKEADSFTSHTNHTTYKTKGNITCTTSNVIYLLSCRVCGLQYIGETMNTLKKRFYGHRSTVNTNRPPVGQHFNLPNHSMSDMILQGIESLGSRSEVVRLSREKLWMKRLLTIQPHGLNVQEGND